MSAVAEKEGQHENHQQGEWNQERNQDGVGDYDAWSSWDDHDCSQEWIGSLDDWFGDWSWSDDDWSCWSDDGPGTREIGGMWNRRVPLLRPDLRVMSLRTPPRMNRHRM